MIDKGLSVEEIKILKQEKKIGYIFCMMIISVGSIANFLIAYMSENPKRFLLALFIEILVLLFGLIVTKKVNKDLNKDIRYGRKIVKQESVYKKLDDNFNVDDVEQNKIASGGIVLPLQQKDEDHRAFGYKIIVKKNVYIIGKELFDNIEENEIIEMHFSEYSNTLFEIKKIE